MYLKSCFSQQEMNIYLECLDLVEEMFKYNLTLSIMKVTYYVNKIDSEFSDSESIDSDNLVSQSSNRAQFFERRSKMAALRVHRFWRDVNYNPIYKRARNNLLNNLKK